VFKPHSHAELVQTDDSKCETLPPPLIIADKFQQIWNPISNTHLVQSLYRTDVGTPADGLCVPSALVTKIADKVKLPAAKQTCKNMTAMCEYPQYPLVTYAVSCDACYANPYVSTRYAANVISWCDGAVLESSSANGGQTEIEEESGELFCAVSLQASGIIWLSSLVYFVSRLERKNLVCSPIFAFGVLVRSNPCTF
jgi:hypothetical protein